MDYLNMLTDADILDINKNISYKSNFTLDKLFASKKTPNLFVEAERMTEGSNIPVMAQVHSFDTEARIGDRPSFEQLKLEKLFIKEKINATERMMYYKDERGVGDSQLKNFIFDDVLNMYTRVGTRTSVMIGELLSNGKLTIKENNVDTVVDYGMPAENTIAMTGWATPSHDILSDIQKVVTTAKQKGYNIVRAITSTKVFGYLLANDRINEIFAKRTDFLTDIVLKDWLKQTFGIEFVLNDEIYLTDLSKKKTNRIYKEDNITWLTTDGVLGGGLYGVTPEEKLLPTEARGGNISVIKWTTKDPVALWTKASGVYLPVVKDINGLFISTVAGA